MMISFGGGGSAAYLTGAQDSKGRERESVEVLRGDPFEVEALADALSFEHKSTTAVIAWAPGDDPTAAQIREVLHEFEKTAWAGLEPDRYAWSAVQHRDGNGGVHLHVLTARVELETGKSLNIAPPAGKRPSMPSGTGRTTRTTGAARTIRPGRGTMNRGIRPASTPTCAAPAFPPRRIPGGSSPTTSVSASSPGPSRTGRRWSPPCGKPAWTCRARASTTSPFEIQARTAAGG